MATDRDDGSPRLRLLVASVLVVVVVLGGAIAGAVLVDVEEPTPPGSFEHAYADGSVTVTYTGDEPITADRTDRLEVVAPDRNAGVVWAATESSFPVEAGDSVTLEGVEPGDTVQVVWTGTDEEEIATLAEFEV